MTGGTVGMRTVLEGVAVVCCVHDREKRKIIELEFDPRETKVHLCACCENLFLERTDIPMFCPQCRRPPSYVLGGPLPDPIGEV
jgi:hypothetical protein